MSKVKEMIPPAKALINGIRAIGYSFSTAVADIIDNSLSAESTRVDMYYDSAAEDPYFAILDNGTGMDEEELNNAMVFGSDRSDKSECKEELGRFGLGLKSASLSQCRKLIVISKKDGVVRSMAYDLDYINQTGNWNVFELDYDEYKKEPCFEKLDEYDHGTLVIWKVFDSISSNSKNFSDSFNKLVKEAVSHVELVFHRFYERVNIYFNNTLVERRDPFLKDSPKTQQGRPKDIVVENEIIKVTPYTLPFANTLTNADRKLLGNPKSIYDEQGFYIYRNERLIYWGSWMHMAYKSEVNKLARVQVDVPSSLDKIWALDVKKSSAKIPDMIKDSIIQAVEDSVKKSVRVTKYKGQKELKQTFPVWQRIIMREGEVKYVVNRDNPRITKLIKNSSAENRQLILDVLEEIEAYFPKGRVRNDNVEEINIVNSSDSIEDTLLLNQLLNLCRDVKEDELEDTLDFLLSFESFSRFKDKRDEILRRLNIYHG